MQLYNPNFFIFCILYPIFLYLPLYSQTFKTLFPSPHSTRHLATPLHPLPQNTWKIEDTVIPIADTIFPIINMKKLYWKLVTIIISVLTFKPVNVELSDSHKDGKLAASFIYKSSFLILFLSKWGIVSITKIYLVNYFMYWFYFFFNARIIWSIIHNLWIVTDREVSYKFRSYTKI